MTTQGHHDATAANLVDLLRRAAAEHPGGQVLAPRGDTGSAALTFADLDQKARALAAALQRAGVGPGDRALLFYPPGDPLIVALFGCLYAGAVAVPVPAPAGGDRPSAALLAAVAVARPAIALTTIAALVPARAALAGVFDLDDVPWIVIDAVSPASAPSFREVAAVDDVAAILHDPAAPTAAVRLTHARLLTAADPASARAPWLPLLRELRLARGPGLAGATAGSAAGRSRAPAA
ncbi:MAG: AMP-binding protein [Polyangiaceae bacterium]|nr:AMP-binding protein [Polyangiaceae bacterium]